MADLTQHKRDNLQPKQFGLPEERKYPLPDAAHARNALSRVSQQESAGNISHTDAERVRRKAHAKLNG